MIGSETVVAKSMKEIGNAGETGVCEETKERPILYASTYLFVRG